MPTTHVDPKTLDESGSVGMNIMVPWSLHVFGILITPIYLLISCWRAHADYRNHLWAATLLLGTLVVTPMAFNSIKKHNTLGIFIIALRSYVLPLYILSLTLYKEWTSTVCGLFILLRGTLSICTYLAKPPPVTTGNDGKPQNLRIMLAGDSFFPKVDGVSTFSTHSIRYLQQNGHIVHVMTSKKGPSPLFGATVTRLPGIIPRSIDPHHSITLPIPWLLYPTLFRFKPHVVHVFESILPFSLGVMLACWLLDIPLVISHHTRIDMYAKWGTPWLPHWLLNILLVVFYRGIISFGDLNIGVCPSLIEWLRWTWTPGGLQPEMWKSGCEVDVFKPENATIETRRKLTQSRPDLPLIIYVGRMAQEKDSIELLPIFRRLHQRLNGKVRVALIGGGPMKKMMEMAAQDDKYILFPGFLHGEELYSAYATGNVFFSPSTTEGFPLVFLEAMASGTPVVGANEGGTPLTFENGQHGIHFPSHDQEAAVQAIVDVLSAGEKMKQLCVPHARTFTWKLAIDYLEQKYFKVIRRASCF